MNLVALYGFLGCSRDWELWDAHSLGVNRIWPLRLKPKGNFQTFAKELNAWAKAELKPPRGIMGYSLGGRLALHALLDDPSIWSKGILISTHPGLVSEEERCRRLKQDSVWAERFLKDPWEILMRDWEGQAVFKNENHRFLRKERDYRRIDLAEWLTCFSLGLQENLLLKIPGLSLPLFWVTGEHDPAYTAIADQACSCHKLSKGFIIRGGYHRACFAYPQSFSDFMRQLTS
jgi:2-succinyl-6-hydroxy-2,4-cyclohexadiene-1-carboxylate synthase